MMTEHLYRCPNCRDEMDPKFCRTHVWICWWISMALTKDVQRWIDG